MKFNERVGRYDKLVDLVCVLVSMALIAGVTYLFLYTLAESL